MKKITWRAIQSLLCLVLFFEFTGCGYLMYPDRRGQKGGQIDPGIAILDGVGLLLFVIPGIVAYAIDFTNGTIYFPNTYRRSSLNSNDMKQSSFDPQHYNRATIESIIRKQTGVSVNLGQDNIRVTKLKSLEDMRQRFALVLPSLQSTVIVNAAGR